LYIPFQIYPKKMARQLTFHTDGSGSIEIRDNGEPILSAKPHYSLAKNPDGDTLYLSSAAGDPRLDKLAFTFDFQEVNLSSCEPEIVATNASELFTELRVNFFPDALGSNDGGLTLPIQISDVNLLTQELSDINTDLTSLLNSLALKSDKLSQFVAFSQATLSGNGGKLSSDNGDFLIINATSAGNIHSIIRSTDKYSKVSIINLSIDNAQVGQVITLKHLSNSEANSAYRMNMRGADYALQYGEIIELYTFGGGSSWTIYDKKRIDASDVLGLSKSSVGLANVDNTSDANKPISTAQQTALNGKQNALGFTPENQANKNTANGYLGANANGNLANNKLEGATYANALPASIQLNESKQFGQPATYINNGSIVFADFSNAKYGAEVLIFGNFATFPLNSTELAKVEWVDGMGVDAWRANTPLCYSFTYIGNNEVLGQIFSLTSTTSPLNLRNFDDWVREVFHNQGGTGAGAARLYEIASAGTPTLSYVVENDGRYMLLNTAASAIGRHTYHTSAIFKPVNGIYVSEHLIRIPDLSSGTETFYIKVGFDTTVSAETGTDVAQFYYRHNVNSGRWRIRTRKDSGTTNDVDLGLGFEVAANTKYKLRVELDCIKAEARFFINDTLVQTVTGVSLPINIAAAGIGMQAGIYKTVGTTQRNLHLFYFERGIDNIF
jgi:hypothetical protein